MDRTLFVIVGAGASYDAAEDWPTGTVRPPLVRELFSRRHRDILADYPMAQNAAPETRDALADGRDGQAITLETHLREMYRDSDDPYDKRRFFSIALYLQDLLWRASKAEGVHFANTDRLVATLVRHFDHVCFVTLNYDTILDQALGKLDRLSSIKDYIGYGRWSLIKLHGSVDWGYGPFDDVSVDDPPADLTAHLNTIDILKTHESSYSPLLDEPPRYLSPGGTQIKGFPALTVPVGEEDEVVCPDEHQRHLDERLRAQGELDLLIVGYSAYDKTVLERLVRSERRIRTLTVVNDGLDAADQVVARLKDQIPQSLNGTEIEASTRTFGDWCRQSLTVFASHHPALA